MVTSVPWWRHLSPPYRLLHAIKTLNHILKKQDKTFSLFLLTLTLSLFSLFTWFAGDDALATALEIISRRWIRRQAVNLLRYLLFLYQWLRLFILNTNPTFDFADACLFHVDLERDIITLRCSDRNLGDDDDDAQLMLIIDDDDAQLMMKTMLLSAF
ncbi:unnamed protein product [Vicia faba]|uniref:Uncharacterized protein n=1 Tax=Vicia faba TaxID=3906 RepID=A0AAV0YC98_VICFA|nr:unnamed protein product [Vicia faba]